MTYLASDASPFILCYRQWGGGGGGGVVDSPAFV